MVERYRITYEKKDALRYVSHLDLQKIWIRTVLRTGIQLFFTQGFHPAPKMAPGWPLALGWAGYGEMIDLWFDFPEEEVTSENRTEAGLMAKINQSCPPGLKITELKLIPIYDPALTTVIESAVYHARIKTPVSPDYLRDQMEALMARPTIERKRRNKPYDLKPLIEGFQVLPSQSDQPVLEIQMAARDSAMGRPDEVMAELGYDVNEVVFARTRLILKQSPVPEE